MPIGQDLDVLLMSWIIMMIFDDDTDYVLDDDNRWLGLLKIEVPRSPGIETLPSLNILVGKYLQVFIKVIRRHLTSERY